MLTDDGVGADWPFGYEQLKPYYTLLEQELPVAGQSWPWGDPHDYPHSPHPVGGNGEVFLRGAAALGLEVRIGPVAITNGRFGNRSHCIYRGFCLQGCKVNAKASPLITHVPDALAHGAEIREACMVSRIAYDERTGRAAGVHYFKDGVEHLQRARAVAVAAYSIETPRLLLNSTSGRFPNGMCNDHDLVGRYLMVQGAPQVAGRYAQEVRAYKAPPPEASSEVFYETDPKQAYVRGFSLQSVAPLPIAYSEHVAAEGHWGAGLRERMRDYVHWSVLGALCDFLPQGENDRLLMEAAKHELEALHRAAGATQTMTVDRYAHLVGGARMAQSPEQGVVDGCGLSFAVPNLWVAGGSALPTQGSANPALTIMALAARVADHMKQSSRGTTPHRETSRG
jgi:choline dehydrogenase-like flavoprotein